LPKTLFNKWFGEETSLGEIIKEMVERKNINTNHISVKEETKIVDLAQISSEIRYKVDDIIKKYNNEYVWYSYFIVDRISRHLLAES
jgi:hypothetical protein